MFIKKISAIFFVMLVISTLPTFAKTIEKNVDTCQLKTTSYEARFEGYAPELTKHNTFDYGKINQVISATKLYYDKSNEYDWYALTWTVECKPVGSAFFFIENAVDVNEMCSDIELIDYGPFENTGGTQTVGWTLELTAGYKGAQVSVSYSNRYTIEEIQIAVYSDMDIGLAKWVHSCEGECPSCQFKTNTYKPGIIIRVEQDTDIEDIILRMYSLGVFVTLAIPPQKVYPVTWDAEIGGNFKPEQPDPPSGGPANNIGKVDKEYTFSVQTVDPEWGDLTYEIDWGDDTTSTKTGASDDVTEMTHKWTTKGDYYIKVRAKDDKNEWSGWSHLRTIEIEGKGKTKDLKLIDSFEKIIDRFLFIKNLFPSFK